ncbi:MAG: fibronectin type III domain-containing protein [Chloroflexi bacterium]|nr:fibronectin type III domain-containing protein [Chloroflexota bacterium]
MRRLDLDPSGETPVQVRTQPQYTYRFAYARSADSQSTGDTGQDYLVVLEEEATFIFALCDGVSQSFFGDIAARTLADALVAWLAGEPAADSTVAESAVFCQALHDYLQSLTATASQRINHFALPEDTPPLLRDVLEQKRQLGSESTFVCGRVDLPKNGWPGGRLALAWMGDSRLRLWGLQEERSQLFGDTFHSGQRWSTRRGPIGGPPNCLVSTLSGLAGLTVYSDGLALLDGYGRLPDDRELNQLLAQAQARPESDDISFLDLALSRPAEPELAVVLEPPQQLAAAVRDSRLWVTWQPVAGASAYQVQLAGRERPQSWQTTQPQWQSPAPLPGGEYQVRVRALQNTTAGPWSEAQPVSVTRPKPVKPPPRRQPSVYRTGLIVAPFLCLLLLCGGLAVWSSGHVRGFVTNLLAGTPTATPSPVVRPPATPSLTPSPALTGTATASPSPTLTETPPATPTPAATATPSPTATLSLTTTATPPTATPTLAPLPAGTTTPAATTVSYQTTKAFKAFILSLDDYGRERATNRTLRN